MIAQVETALATIGVMFFEGFFDSTKKYKNASGELITINEYITYQVISETPSQYANDVDEYTELLIDVDYYTKNKANANTNKLKIRDALRNADLLIDDTVMQYEASTGYYHTTITVRLNGATEKYVAPSSST